ncbi:MAG: RNA polymerase sigma factor [Bacteroidota bacterium]
MNGDISLPEDCDIELLYASCKDPLLGLLRSKLADQTLAEDILHDAFERFEQFRRSGKICHHPKAYLFRIALNLLNDYYRKQEKEKRETNHLYFTEEFSTIEMPSSCDLTQCIQHLLKQLSPENRDALIGVYFHEMPQHELAKKLNIPPSTLKSRVQRSRKYLLKAYRACVEKGQ